MNWRRGLFRLWLVFSALFVVVIAVLSFESVKTEFEEARIQWSLPVNCAEARGKIGVDYDDWNSPGKDFCWYKIKEFRTQYPEYNNLTDDELSNRLYKKAGLPIKEPPAPWTLVLKVIAVAIGGPFISLVVGAALVWSFAGFAIERKINLS